MKNTIDKLLKGILAADESIKTINKRFEKVGIEPTKENRIEYRKFLFDTENIEEYIGGVILYDEQIKDKNIVEILNNKNLAIGIKVDEGLKDTLLSKEQNTKGLNGLSKRCEMYKTLGASFTKWRAVFRISKNTPTDKVIKKNTNDLVEYARVSLENGLIPIIEPEILMEGNHTIEMAQEVSERVYKALFDKISSVDLPNIILKTGFITTGSKNSQKTTREQNVALTLDVLYRLVPNNIGGIVFLSGGLSGDTSREILSMLTKENTRDIKMSFSFGRALQEEALMNWNEDKNKAKEEFIEVLKKTSLAI